MHKNCRKYIFEKYKSNVRTELNPSIAKLNVAFKYI